MLDELYPLMDNISAEKLPKTRDIKTVCDRLTNQTNTDGGPERTTLAVAGIQESSLKVLNNHSDASGKTQNLKDLYPYLK